MDRDTFANTIKQKYPEYQNMDNNSVVDAVLKKYPQYKSQIKEPTVLNSDQKVKMQDDGSSYFSNVATGFKEGADRLTTELKKAGQGYQEGIRKGGAEGLVDSTKSLLRGGLRATGAVTEQAFTPILEIPVVKDAMEWVAGKVGSTEEGRKLGEIIKNNPEKSQDIMDIINIVTLGSAKELTAPLGKASSNLLKSSAESVSNAVTQGAKVVENIDNSITKGVQSVTEPVGEVFDKSGKAIVNTKDTVKKIFGKLEPKNYEEAVSSIEDAYKTSFVENKVGINQKLSKLAKETGKTPDDLIYTLAKEGIVPEIEGKLAKFDSAYADINAKQSLLWDEIDTALGAFKQRINLDDVRELAHVYLQSSDFVNSAELLNSTKELDRVFESIKMKYGDDVSLQDLNRINKDMNDITKAHDGEIFRQDTSSVIGNVVKDIIDYNVPSKVIRDARAEYGKMIELEKIIKVFDNQPMDVGVFGTQLGRLGGALALGALTTPVSGAGALAIAGIFATYGGDIMAKILRSNKFNKKAQEMILNELRKQPSVIERLLNETSRENERFLRQKLLNTGATPMGGETLEGAVVDISGDTVTVAPKKPQIEVLNAGKYPVSVDPKTGKFQTVFSEGADNIKGQTIPKVHIKKWGDVNKFTNPKSSPLVTGKYSILTGENPMGKALTVEENTALNKKLLKRLIEDGYEPIPVQGKYGGNLENSFIVPNMSDDMAIQYAKEFNQESVLTPKGLLYKDGTVNPADLKNIDFNSSQSDNFSTININGQDVKFSVPIDFEKRIPLKDLKSNKLNKTESAPAVAMVGDKDSQQKDDFESKVVKTLMQLESSGGKDTRSADKGEVKWLTGLTNVAIKELKRVGLLDNIDVNNEAQVLDASSKYFTYLMSRNPKLSPAEVYVDKYWNGWKKLPNGREIRQKKIEQFNEHFNG